MTDYVKSTNFASKDSLAIGNPLKIVKGTEIDTEFNNIATAVATKADLNSPAFIGTPTAPTPASGNSTTLLATTAFVATAVSNGITSERSAATTLTNKTIQDAVLTGNPTAPTPETSDSDTSVATTAFVKAALQLLYPVGSIYINANVTTNPASLLGFGTWVAFGAGRVMAGLDGSNSAYDSLQETGGAYGHNHTMASAGAHAHTVSRDGWGVEGGALGAVAAGRLIVGSGQGEIAEDLESLRSSANLGSTNTVSSHTHDLNAVNTVDPYIVVAMWRRTA